MSWSIRGRPCTVSLFADLAGGDVGQVRIVHAGFMHLTTATGPQDDVVELEAAPCRFGGQRW